MLPLATDEDVNGNIISGLRLRQPDIDLVTVQEAGLGGSPDPDVLEWAASQGRILVTQDENTMAGHAWDRVRAGKMMPGVLVRRQALPLGQSIDELQLIAVCGDAEDFRDQVRFLPL